MCIETKIEIKSNTIQYTKYNQLYPNFHRLSIQTLFSTSKINIHNSFLTINSLNITSLCNSDMHDRHKNDSWFLL